MKFIAIIPARYASTRFPGKPLALLGGKPVIRRVYEQVAGVLDDVAVVHTRYVYHPGARLDFEYKVYREADGILCAEGSTAQVCIDTEGMLMVDSPDYYKEWQARYREQNDNHP